MIGINELETKTLQLEKDLNYANISINDLYRKLQDAGANNYYGLKVIDNPLKTISTLLSENNELKRSELRLIKHNSDLIEENTSLERQRDALKEQTLELPTTLREIIADKELSDKNDRLKQDNENLIQALRRTHDTFKELKEDGII